MANVIVGPQMILLFIFNKGIMTNEAIFRVKTLKHNLGNRSSQEMQ